MMRNAGRAKDGTAKAISVTQNGEIINSDYKIIKEYGSPVEVLPGKSWSSEYLENLGNVRKMIIHTSFNTSQLHRVRVEELAISEVEGQGGKKINTIQVRNQDGAVTMSGNQHLEVLLSDATIRARIIVENVSSNAFNFGIYAYASKDDLLSFYNDETYRFETQKEIANQTTLKELLEAVKNLNSDNKESLPKKPILKNVSILEDTGCDQILWFHDGFFYANKKSARQTLVKSSDGRTWEDVHTFTFEAPTSGISKVLVGDTGHILVGNTSGEVYVSDSKGGFSSTPTFTTGKLSHKFGRFKHENVLGITTYDAQGFDNGQKHEAWLSTDNGATYNKVFDNMTLQNLLTEYPASDAPQVHIHDIEYDPYSGRLYIWQGDLNTATFYYSDDWGVSWNLGFPRGAANNHTQLIATVDGLTFGADTAGGGAGFLPLDRRKNIKPIIDIKNFDRDHWKFNHDGERFVAGGKWVDRENDVYLMTYTVEFDDNAERSAPLAYSKNGKDWQVLWHNFEKGHATGFDTIFYGNGLLVGSYRKIGEPYKVFIAEADL